MKTLSKFSPFNRYYYISNQDENLFWEKNVVYGFDFENNPIVDMRFVSELKDAMALTWDEVLQFKAQLNKGAICGGKFKTDTSTLRAHRFPELITEEDAIKIGLKI